ncbi:MAG: dGTP triphosphohydrolase [Planctomycetota bacterium]
MKLENTEQFRQRPVSARECSWAEREQILLASYATFAVESAGRRFEEPTHLHRSPFQRDRDRVLHSSAFRRLSGKMQVFTGDRGDYHRTRLTHTQEVATIARTIGRGLKLNEDLIEALALLHDIGHPPFGHSGEAALNSCLAEQGGFSHNQFALVLAEELETRYTPYPGLNLTKEVLAGQDFRITHSGLTPSLEVQVVDLSDSLTYNAHDVDDALTLGLLDFHDLQDLDLVRRAKRWTEGRIPLGVTAQARQKSLIHSLIDVQVADVLETSAEKLSPMRGMSQLSVRQLELELDLSPVVASEKEQLGQFLFDRVYRHPELIEVRERAATRVRHLFECLVNRPQLLPERFRARVTAAESAAEKKSDGVSTVGLGAEYAKPPQNYPVELAAGHYIAGMTDRFCDARYEAFTERNEQHPVDW